MTWERFCNWLMAEPWRWRYDRIYQALRSEGHGRRWSFWHALAFPHVHFDIYSAEVSPPFEVSERGFIQYPPIPSESAGRPEYNNYGTRLRIYESSAAAEPSLWITAEGRGMRDDDPARKKVVHRAGGINQEILEDASVAVHLTRAGVETAVEQLVGWLQRAG